VVILKKVNCNNESEIVDYLFEKIRNYKFWSSHNLLGYGTLVDIVGDSAKFCRIHYREVQLLSYNNDTYIINDWFEGNKYVSLRTYNRFHHS
jgi:hypothetical protein